MEQAEEKLEAGLIEAVKDLRAHLGESQQAFATRLGLSMSAIANYERDRSPTGKALVELAAAADAANRPDLAEKFLRALVAELGLRRHKKISMFGVGLGEEGKLVDAVMLVKVSGTENVYLLKAIHDVYEALSRGLNSSNTEMRALAKRMAIDFRKAALGVWSKYK
jgi:transcriptional regulator with XRE-family HTH domain